MIKREIAFELARGGLVFYLHNDNASINVVYHNLKIKENIYFWVICLKWENFQKHYIEILQK